MFGTLLAVVATGFVIMVSLFLYWLKYVYVEKDDDKNRQRYFPISNIEEIERRKKQIQMISQKLKQKNKAQNKNKNMNNEEKQPLKANKENVKNINEMGVAEHSNLLDN